jgi:hypothetical protein
MSDMPMDDDEAKEAAFDAMVPTYRTTDHSLNTLKIGFDEGWAAARRTQPPEATATRDRRISVGWALLEALRRREAGEATREDQSYAYLHDAWHDASPKPQNGRS